MALRDELIELVDAWAREIAAFATKDDPYYNGVRQCLQDLKAICDEDHAPLKADSFSATPDLQALRASRGR